MLRFNGIDITDISDALETLVKVSTPEIILDSIPTAIADGEQFARLRYGKRSITLEFTIFETDMQLRTSILRDIKAWGVSRTPLHLEVPQEDNGYLIAICTQLPTDNADRPTDDIEMVFTALDPYYYSRAEKLASVSSRALVLHDTEPNWRIEQAVTAELTSPSWSINGKTLTFTTIPAGALVLDGNTETATLDGGTILTALSGDSRFPQLAKGANQIEVANGAGGTIYWRERWL